MQRRKETEKDGIKGTAKDTVKGTINENVEIHLSPSQRKTLQLLSENPEFTADELASDLGIHVRSVKNNIKNLKEVGLLLREGSDKNGRWVVLSTEKSCQIVVEAHEYPHKQSTYEPSTADS